MITESWFVLSRTKNLLRYLISLIALLSIAITYADNSFPKPIGTTKPIYPKELVEEGVEGTVKLLVEVLNTGSVGSIDVLNSPHQLLSDSAIESVSTWSFEPAVEDGVAVTKKIAIPLVFKAPTFSQEAKDFERLIAFLGRNPYVEIDPETTIVKMKDLGGAKVLRQHMLPYNRCYPKSHTGTGVVGIAKTTFLINSNGEVVNPEIIEIDVPELKLFALKTLVGIKFKPFELEGAEYVKAFMPIKVQETNGLLGKEKTKK